MQTPGINRGRVRLGAAGLITALALLAPGAADAGSSTAPVAVGDYQAALELDGGATYSLGVFSVAKVDGKRSIVPTTGYNGIFYPDAGECDQFDIPLSAPSIPISATGRFKIKDKAAAEDQVIAVSFKGHWTKAKRVAGTVSIKSGTCTSTLDWKASKSV